MGLSISPADFNGQKLSPSDFKLDKNSTSLTFGSKSVAQIAAGETMMSDTPSVEDFRRIKNELMSPRSRETFILRQENKRRAIMEDSKEEFQNILLDPNLDNDTKKQFLNDIKNTSDNFVVSPTDLMVEQAVLADSGPNETEEEHQNRLEYIDMVQEVNNHKMKMASRINAIESARDPDFASKATDFAELIMPLGEWGSVATMYRDLTGNKTGQGAFLMGSQREELYKVLNKLPYNKRAEVSEKLMSYVENNDNIILPDGNDIIALDTISNMVLNNDYSQTEKWVDNVFSIIDITGVLGTALKVAKAPKIGAKLSKEAKRFESAEENLGKLGKEAQEFKAEEPKTDLGKEAEAFKPSEKPSQETVFDNESKARTQTEREIAELDESVEEGKLGQEARQFEGERDPTVEDIFGETEKRQVHTEVNPASPSQLIKDANSEKARALHNLAVEDESGEAAEALYGASREEALSKDILPEPEVREGEMPNKAKLDGPEYEEPLPIREARSRDGNSYLTESEVQTVKTRLVSGLENVEGMVPHKESMTIKANQDGSTNISMMYRPTDTGFKTADRALQNAKFAFRHYGMGEDNFDLYRRSGDTWVKTTQKELSARKALRDEFTSKKKKIPANLKDIDYAVGINYNYRFRPEDLQGYDLLSTGKLFGLIPTNILDYTGKGFLSKARQGSLTQNFLDAASVLHPRIVEPASVAVDKGVKLEKLYVDTFKKFTKEYSKLKESRRMMMDDYIHEANFKGLELDTSNLYSRGFTSDEIEILKEWRHANDVMYYAANDDLAISMHNKGYKVFTNDDTSTRLIAKPQKRGAVGANTYFYNATTDSIERVTDVKELDDLYEGGGTLAKLAEPIEIDGVWVDMVKSPESSAGGYLRSIRDGERMLHYRSGYYPVMYDANFFITKKMKKADGTTFEKTIASSKTRGDAEHLVKEIRDNEGLGVEDVTYREDRKIEGNKRINEDGWSLGVSTGMTSQKVRGKRLEDAAGGLHLYGKSNLHDPLEAVNTQIRQLSQRVSMRNYLDTVKKRWVDNYADKVGLEKDFNNEYKFPSSLDQLKPIANVPRKTLADARSMFNYIYSLENGYINGIDEAFKGVFNAGAEIMSALKWGKGEEALRGWGKGSYTNTAKAAVFKMFLAANPPRQLIIQSHQIVQLNALNPKYMAGPMQWDLYRLGRAMRGYEGDKEAVEMLNELRNSGMMEAVDANNLVRNDVQRLANTSWTQKVGGVANFPLKWAQKLGFDNAERAVLVTSWLAHRDMAVKAGKKLDRRGYDEIAGEARAYTYNMNRAGDMPYNQNTLSMIAQFMQVPHKAMLQPLVARGLTGRQRAQLLTWNTVMYGVPVAAVGTVLHPMMEPSPERDVLEDGLEDVLLNATLSAVSGEKQDIDWGDLAPSDLHGMSDVVLGFWTSDVGKMVVESPSGSLLFGANPRITETAKTMGRWAHILDDYDDPELDTKFTDVALAAANLFSGYSNAFKSKYAWETGKKINSLGNITDSDVTKLEAGLQFFGFRTRKEVSSREINEIIYKNRSFDGQPGGDVDKWYSELKRQLARKGMTVKDRDLAQRIVTEGMRVFDDDPSKFRDRLYSLIKSDVEDNQYNIIQKVIDEVGWKSKSEVNHLVELLPDSPEKQKLREMVNMIGEE